MSSMSTVMTSARTSTSLQQLEGSTNESATLSLLSPARLSLQAQMGLITILNEAPEEDRPRLRQYMLGTIPGELPVLTTIRKCGVIDKLSFVYDFSEYEGQRHSER
ncbi:MAG: hypothetical protein Q7U16_12370 [Agitococcus sp.]|nr:hypothetical protein [Agitococcus sp.]